MDHIGSANKNNNYCENKSFKSETDLKPKSDQCNYFKSSYARSLSFSKNLTQSLNLSVNYDRGNINCESNESDNVNNYQCVNVIDDIKTQQKKNQTTEENHHHCKSCASSNSYTFDSILLQTQVNTLQWQLKQAESTRQMYQTVLEEVVRFLKKCYQHLNLLVEPWPRSKSEKHIVINNNIRENVFNLEPMKTQSTINLHNLAMPGLLEGDFHKLSLPGDNNNNKKFNLNLDTEKLSKDAFRLYRTTENLINMKEATLMPVPQNSDDPTELRTNEIIPQLNKTFNSFTTDSEISSLDLPENKTKNMDGISLRSYTTGSIHSNSSKSSGITDDLHTTKVSSMTPVSILSKQLHSSRNKNIHTNSPSCIDAESGFSSMNSFQEIGVPLVNSMQILMAPNLSGTNSFSSSNEDSELHHQIVELDKLQNDYTIQRKWSSLPLSSKKTPAQLLEFKCDETLKVVWV